jgi:DUF971 family protein
MECNSPEKIESSNMSSAKSPLPVSLKSEGGSLVITWNDGVTHRLKWSFLREQCPCATCRAERENPTPKDDNPLNILKPEEAQPIRPVDMRPIGNYAYGIAFNDGHNTGIYSMEFLRFLGEHIAEHGSTAGLA